jgi:hypothetical protein
MKCKAKIIKQEKWESHHEGHIATRTHEKCMTEHVPIIKVETNAMKEYSQRASRGSPSLGPNSR